MILAALLALADPAQPPPPSDLPGDAALPSLDRQLAIPLGPAAGTSERELPAVLAGTLPIELAAKAARAALSRCGADGYRVGVAVVDENGLLRAGLSADGAQPGRIYVAIRKALTALAFREPSSRARLAVQSDPAQRARVRPNMALFAGAVPLMAGDRLVGAVAASGATQNEDEACAAAGEAAIREELK